MKRINRKTTSKEESDSWLKVENALSTVEVLIHTLCRENEASNLAEEKSQKEINRLKNDLLEVQGNNEILLNSLDVDRKLLEESDAKLVRMQGLANEEIERLKVSLRETEAKANVEIQELQSALGKEIQQRKIDEKLKDEMEKLNQHLSQMAYDSYEQIKHFHRNLVAEVRFRKNAETIVKEQQEQCTQFISSMRRLEGELSFAKGQIETLQISLDEVHQSTRNSLMLETTLRSKYENENEKLKEAINFANCEIHRVRQSLLKMAKEKGEVNKNVGFDLKNKKRKLDIVPDNDVTWCERFSSNAFSSAVPNQASTAEGRDRDPNNTYHEAGGIMGSFTNAQVSIPSTTKQIRTAAYDEQPGTLHITKLKKN